MGLLHSTSENVLQRKRTLRLRGLYKLLAHTEPRKNSTKPHQHREQLARAAEAIKLYRSGISPTQLARQRGASRRTAAGWIKAEGVPMRHASVTDKHFAEAMRLRDQGLPYAVMAHRWRILLIDRASVGRYPTTMSSALVESLLKEEATYARESKEAREVMIVAAERRQEAILGLHTEGLSVRVIARMLGCSAGVVQDAIERARSRRPPMSRREHRVSWELHRAVADRIRRDPGPVLSIARRNIARMNEQRRDEYAQSWVDEWERLVSGSVPALIKRMLDTDERASDLRQMTPFAGALTQDERVVAIHKAASRAA